MDRVKTASIMHDEFGLSVSHSLASHLEYYLSE